MFRKRNRTKIGRIRLIEKSGARPIKMTRRKNLKEGTDQKNKNVLSSGSAKRT